MKSFFRNTIKAMIPRNLLVRKLDPRSSNSVLLTFDDGPHPEVTPAVLDRLKAYEARAIFFIVGRRIENAPYLLNRIQEEGHIIGNHTYIHSNGSQPWFLAYWRDLIRCQELIEKFAGERPHLFRPAGGGLSPTTLMVPWLTGLKTVLWSLEADDWRCRTTNEARKAAEELIGKITSRDIVLLHDDNQYVLEILDIILPAIQSLRHNLAKGADFL